jgi:hypothetical protein
MLARAMVYCWRVECIDMDVDVDVDMDMDG